MLCRCDQDFCSILEQGWMTSKTLFRRRDPSDFPKFSVNFLHRRVVRVFLGVVGCVVQTKLDSSPLD